MTNKKQKLQYLAGGISVGNISGPDGPLTSPPSGEEGTVLANTLSGAIGAMTIIAAIYFLFQIITGGINIMNAGGDPGKLETARKKITYGLIGFIVVALAIVLVNLVSWIIGFDTPFDLYNWINILAIDTP